jgi:2,3-bisphosphoglycerate-independent phosphoglycerate mutase
VIKNNGPCVLMILDGWGIAGPNDNGNAVAMAKTPFLDRMISDYPNTRLQCSGPAVGLPDGIMGNSEVGHLNIGAGRVVNQGLLRINMAIQDRSFFENETFVSAMSKVKGKKSALHLMGLVSDGGVHSQLTHLFALIDMAIQKGISDVFIHVILDGRDTPPDSGVKYVTSLQAFLETKGTGRIASICGRYYAMDRDTRWERTEQAYRLYTNGDGIKEKNPVSAIENAYAKGQTDEFVEPVVIVKENGNPVKLVSDNDGIIFFNFRPDRARQITRAFMEPGFNLFIKEKSINLCDFVCMALYDEAYLLPVAFPPVHLKKVLGEVVSEQGLNQLRIAETEKYAHVTYFFNGGREKPFPNEDRHLVPSPREVATYDQKPEMSALEVAEKAVFFIQSNKYHMIVLNFANLDMVGHTGIIEAAVKACETVDQCAEKVVTAVLEKRGTVLVTADHGNAEKMKDENNRPFTAHTLNPVPLVLVSDNFPGIHLREGVLGDIAPTILDIMNIKKPVEMTGKSLIVKVNSGI